MSKEDSLKEVQALLADAKKLIDQATEICRRDQLEGVQFMNMTFRVHRDRWGANRELAYPDFYDDEYWTSSSSECELIYKDEE